MVPSEQVIIPHETASNQDFAEFRTAVTLFRGPFGRTVQAGLVD